MSNVYPVAVAERWLRVYEDSRKEGHVLQCDRVAMARVVLAAATVIDTLPSSYDPHDDLVVRHAQALNALAAALKGGNDATP